MALSYQELKDKIEEHFADLILKEDDANNIITIDSPGIGFIEVGHQYDSIVIKRYDWGYDEGTDESYNDLVDDIVYSHSELGRVVSYINEHI